MKNSTVILIFIIFVAVTQVQALETYTLYNVLSSTTVRLIDWNGNLVKAWTCTRTPSASTPWLILPDSVILRPQTMANPPMPGPGAGGNIQLINWDGTIRWNYFYASTNYQHHHDAHPMPNGNVLLIAWDRKTNTEARAMGRVDITGEMWPLHIVEVDPNNDSIVWEWHLWDHLIQDVDPGKPNYGVVRDHPELMDINFGKISPGSGDWIHANTLDYNPELDQIAFSSHNTSEIYVIDHSTTTEEARTHRGGNSDMGGDILYRWGNPQAYKRGTSADQRLFIVHGINWIRPGYPGAGNMLMFNNGDRPGTSGDSSSIEEIATPRTGYTYYIHPDSAFGPRQPTWVYSKGTSFYSFHLAGAFRLASGNTHITEGTTGRLFEVNPSGQIVWTFNAGGQVQNSKKYDFTPTSVEEEPFGAHRHCARLQILPNPCRIGTDVRFTIDNRNQHREIKLQIFDTGGRVVKSFPLATCNSLLSTAISWDLCDQNGKALPAGVYFAELEFSPIGDGQAADREVVVKLVLIK